MNKEGRWVETNDSGALQMLVKKFAATGKSWKLIADS
jgi:hypothetical protein